MGQEPPPVIPSRQDLHVLGVHVTAARHPQHVEPLQRGEVEAVDVGRREEEKPFGHLEKQPKTHPNASESPPNGVFHEEPQALQCLAMALHVALDPPHQHRRALGKAVALQVPGAQAQHLPRAHGHHLSPPPRPPTAPRGVEEVRGPKGAVPRRGAHLEPLRVAVEEHRVAALQQHRGGLQAQGDRAHRQAPAAVQRSEPKVKLAPA